MVSAFSGIIRIFRHFLLTAKNQTETATRLPEGAPLASGPDDPQIQKAIGLCFVLFLIGVTLQVIKLRGKHKKVVTA